MAIEKQMIDEIIEWDVHHWSKSLNFWKRLTSLNLENCSCLEIGGRNGGLSLWLALQGSNVICSDINGPTEKAKLLHSKYRVTDNIQYSNINAINISYDDETFDLVIFKSVLGGVGANNNKEAQRTALKEIHRVLKPGGELFFAENLTASPIHSIMRKKFVRWGNSWRYIHSDEIDEFFQDFSSLSHQCVGFLSTFGRSESQRKYLGVIDDIFVNHIIPQKWKYVLMGVAKK